MGKKVSEVIDNLKRQVIDAEVEVEFNRRKYKGKQKRDVKKFRMVAIYNTEEKNYHTYITNIPTDRLDAEDIAVLYSARWEIELIFKELKSRYGIDILPFSNPQIVKVLLWMGILALIISRRVYLLVFSANLENAPRYTHLRWATIFVEKAHRLLDAILDYSGIDPDLMELFDVYQRQALAPNVNRKRVMDEWRA